MENEVLKVKVKKLDKLKDRRLWYYEHQGEEFPVSLPTKKGYIVVREDQEQKMWLIRNKHAEELN